MSLESTPVDWEARESSPKSTPLPWIQRQLRTGLLLACAATQGLAKAEKPPFVAVPLFKKEWLDKNKILPEVSEPPPAPEPPLIKEWLEEPKTAEEFERSIRLNIELLTDSSWPIREGATERLIQIIPKAMELQNPLAPDIMRRLYADRKEKNDGIVLEEKVRMQNRIMPYVLDHIRQLLGRVRSPAAEKTTLQGVLEKQFRANIKGQHTGIDEELEKIADGTDGELSSEALTRLCQKTGCIPDVRNDSIVLRKAQEGEEMWCDGKLCFVRVQNGDDLEVIAFYAPDQSVLLEMQFKKEENVRFAAINRNQFIPWKSSTNEYVPVNSSIPIDVHSADAYAGILPAEKNIHIGPVRFTEFGMQKMRCLKTERLSDGAWQSQIEVKIDDAKCFPHSTLCQLVAASKIHAIDHNGDELDMQSISMVSHDEYFIINIVTNLLPKHLNVFAYQDACQEKIQLSKK